MQITSVHQMLSWNSSTITGPVVLVGDARTMSVSLTTTTNASLYTIQGTNHDGSLVAIPEGQWSTVTALAAQGIYAIQPGMLYLRALQAASTSSATLTLHKCVGS